MIPTNFAPADRKKDTNIALRTYPEVKAAAESLIGLGFGRSMNDCLNWLLWQGVEPTRVMLSKQLSETQDEFDGLRTIVQHFMTCDSEVVSVDDFPGNHAVGAFLMDIRKPYKDGPHYRTINRQEAFSDFAEQDRFVRRARLAIEALDSALDMAAEGFDEASRGTSSYSFDD